MNAPAPEKAAVSAPAAEAPAKPAVAPPSVPKKPAAVPPPAAPKLGAPTSSGVRPPASPARRKPRHVLAALSFIVMVLAPTIATGIYLWTVAADQYVSKVGFSVRREETNSALEILSGLTSLSGSSSSDTDILYEFIQSQKLVSDMDKEVDLRTIWSRPEWDPAFALDPTAPIEELVDYWNKMVRLSYGTGSGLLEVEVRAFTPEDATLIANTLFEKSSDMINDLSAIAREDSIRYARDDLNEAVERLKTAREQVTLFRNENQIVNPELDIQSLGGLLAKLQAEQAAVLIEIDLLRETAREGDPRLDQAQRRLEVIEKRIAAERLKLGIGSAAGGSPAFADLIGEYERLSVDQQFAERAYVTALAAYDGSLADSRRKSRYLAAYMKPTLAETAAYPKRVTLLLMISLFLFLIWSVAVLVAYSVKDRR